MLRQRGFTLLEILVAFVVLGLLGSLMLQLFQGGLRNLDSSEHISHAALLARSKLTELQSQPALTPGLSEGQFDDTYHWRLQLTPYTIDADGQPLPPSRIAALLAELSIHWPADGEYHLQTLLLSKQEQLP